MKPIAWLKQVEPEEGLKWKVKMTTFEEVAKDWEEPITPLYAKQEWVGLTEEERKAIRAGVQTYIDMTQHDYGKAVQQATELKLQEKNS